LWRRCWTWTHVTVGERIASSELHALTSVPVLAWSYRRYILASMPVKKPDIEEFAYTTKKIEASFSNFSAWHQRSKIYPLLWESNALDHKKSREEGAPRDLVLASGRCG
jgi:hypothetical protein